MFNIKRGEIYYVDLGFGEGSEIGKIRPCIIVQNDIGNLHSPTTIILPITHRLKNIWQPTQVILDKGMFNGNGTTTGVVMGEQIRTINKTRIKSFTGERLSPQAMKRIEQSIKVSVGIP
ncbi:mRNA interferase MazF [Keratinibaculum paraultunense]|uniref:mRNA interferase n=1 Tax=Keratinibaculum paraultunense TaxID=1278232 RepID=A0A4R3KTG3_9FIRM|nr:type II toxin-antitoxin system PemK/MazF family toxin [Keratinibaculum paraultunense]QQY79722.1 type II toxin-antitoxin system PemK/MazF family toxin [Keratinibaculum paraultunense]TCS86971.1 mRNA interferase MazF [Keratinibaculum paraultunense]